MGLGLDKVVDVVVVGFKASGKAGPGWSSGRRKGGDKRRVSGLRFKLFKKGKNVLLD